jgi:hypothetical protein
MPLQPIVITQPSPVDGSLKPTKGSSEAEAKGKTSELFVPFVLPDLDVVNVARKAASGQPLTDDEKKLLQKWTDSFHITAYEPSIKAKGPTVS